ncbi:MAG TPA: carbohydrate-binding domain-containing protein [Cellvibrio sp.]|nr:carbohydrate-binding domain-containing protein [Cellvibrio sp.]
MQLAKHVIHSGLATAMLVALTACGGSGGSTNNNSGTTIQSSSVLTSTGTETANSSSSFSSLAAAVSSSATTSSTIATTSLSSIANSSSLAASSKQSSLMASSTIAALSSTATVSSAKSSSSSSVSSGLKSSSSSLVSSSTKSSSSAISSSAVSSSVTSSGSSLGATYPTHEAAADYTWDSNSETHITFFDTSIVVAGAGASVDKTKVTITAAGNYRFTGKLLDGQIIVNTTAKETVRLIFDGINIANSTSAPVNIAKAEKVVVILSDTSKNYLTDPATYVFASGEDEPNAALFSKANLTIAGQGELIVDANYNDAIASKDGLIIHSGNITVDALDDGIRGKDYLVIQSGILNVTSAGDGLKSDNEDVGAGIIAIAGGTIKVTASAGDAISGETAVQITGGSFTLKTGSNGSSTTLSDTSNSMKAIKATLDLNIFAGSFTIDSADDALHANANIKIDGGDFVIASGDDGAHADTSLTINSGTLNVNKSYEGLESAVITINGGNIHVTTSDDGINVAGGTNTGTVAPGGRPGDNFTNTGNYFLYINGGYVYVNANGDGLDANGSIVMTGGTVIVNGPTANNNAAIDYDGTFVISGGYLLAAGSSGMAQAPSTTSSQNSVKINFSSTQAANKLVHIESASNSNLLTFAPAKTYSSVVLSSPNLTTGTSFDLYQGGSSTGTAVDGLYTTGSYSGGTKATSFTPSAKVTNVSK